jgi:hypothetical protein
VITKWSEVYAYNKNWEHKIWDLNLDNIKNIDLKKLDYSTLFEKISNWAILILLSILWLSLIWNSTKFFLDYKNRSRGSKMEEATRIFGKYFPTNLHSWDFSGSINEKRVNEKELEEIRKILKIFWEVHNKVLNDYIFNCIISGETAESIINRLSTIEERRVWGELKIFVNWEPFVFVIEEIIIKENSPLDKKNS